jgi:hypothetical protein
MRKGELKEGGREKKAIFDIQNHPAAGKKMAGLIEKETLILCCRRVGHRADQYRRARWPALLSHIRNQLQESEDSWQKTDGRGQMTDDEGQKTEDRSHMRKGGSNGWEARMLGG